MRVAPTRPGRTDTASVVVPAQPDVVYGAFESPEGLMAWLPPGDMTGRALEYDFRQGGRYRIELTYAKHSTGRRRKEQRAD
jgi:uncharacterized protein YndB with AHSA1/START domain